MGKKFTMGLMGKSKFILIYLHGLVVLCKTFYGMFEGSCGKVWKFLRFKGRDKGEERRSQGGC